MMHKNFNHQEDRKIGDFLSIGPYSGESVQVEYSVASSHKHN
jgi:hypothetical protein